MSEDMMMAIKIRYIKIAEAIEKRDAAIAELNQATNENTERW